MALVDRTEIMDELEQFRKDFSDEEEFLGVVADYIEQVQDEADGYSRLNPKKAAKEVVLQEPAPSMALAIQIYKIMNEVPLWVKSDPAQLTYALAKDLDFHYTFYTKHGDQE